MIPMRAKAMWLLLAIFLLSSGCTMQPFDDAPGGPPQALRLLQDVAVPEGRPRVFMQRGRIVTSRDEFVPHCALEIRHLHGPPRTVPAGIYPISRIQQVVTEVVYGPGGTQLAQAEFGLGLRIGTGIEPDESPPEIFEGYHFWLVDTANVGLLRLTCFGARADPYEAEPPTLVELREVLGPIGVLTSGD
jgi:hypothetical protein